MIIVPVDALAPLAAKISMGAAMTEFESSLYSYMKFHTFSSCFLPLSVQGFNHRNRKVFRNGDDNSWKQQLVLTLQTLNPLKPISNGRNLQTIFSNAFLQWICLNLYRNITEHNGGISGQNASIGSCNGLAPNRQQASAHDTISFSDTPESLTQWASYQIRKIAGCACSGNAGNVLPRRRLLRRPLLAIPACITARASRTCRDACRFRSPALAGKNVPGIPGACAPAILRIWQEAHASEATPVNTDLKLWYRNLYTFYSGHLGWVPTKKLKSRKFLKV